MVSINIVISVFVLIKRRLKHKCQQRATCGIDLQNGRPHHEKNVYQSEYRFQIKLQPFQITRRHFPLFRAPFVARVSHWEFIHRNKQITKLMVAPPSEIYDTQRLAPSQWTSFVEMQLKCSFSYFYCVKIIDILKTVSQIFLLCFLVTTARGTTLIPLSK